jgi:hypothetical protein
MVAKVCLFQILGFYGARSRAESAKAELLRGGVVGGLLIPGRQWELHSLSASSATLKGELVTDAEWNDEGLMIKIKEIGRKQRSSIQSVGV